MDEQRFDAMTKALGEGVTRRRVLGGITAGTLTGLLGWRQTAAAQCAKAGQKPKDAKKGCCPGLTEVGGRCAEATGFTCAAGAGISRCNQTPIWCLDPSGQPAVGTCAAHQKTDGTCACTIGPGAPAQACVGDASCTALTACLPGDPSGGSGGHCAGSSSTPCSPPDFQPGNPACAFLATCSEGFCGGQACGNDADCGAGQVCISGAVFNVPNDQACVNAGNRCAPLCSV
jgi:hypothetical protein